MVSPEASSSRSVFAHSESGSVVGESVCSNPTPAPSSSTVSSSTVSSSTVTVSSTVLTTSMRAARTVEITSSTFFSSFFSTFFFTFFSTFFTSSSTCSSSPSESSSVSFAHPSSTFSSTTTVSSTTSFFSTVSSVSPFNRGQVFLLCPHSPQLLHLRVPLPPPVVFLVFLGISTSCQGNICCVSSP